MRCWIYLNAWEVNTASLIPTFGKFNKKLRHGSILIRENISSVYLWSSIRTYRAVHSLPLVCLVLTFNALCIRSSTVKLYEQKRTNSLVKLILDKWWWVCMVYHQRANYWSQYLCIHPVFTAVHDAWRFAHCCQSQSINWKCCSGLRQNNLFAHFGTTDTVYLFLLVTTIRVTTTEVCFTQGTPSGYAKYMFCRSMLGSIISPTFTVSVAGAWISKAKQIHYARQPGFSSLMR